MSLHALLSTNDSRQSDRQEIVDIYHPSHSFDSCT